MLGPMLAMLLMFAVFLVVVCVTFRFTRKTAASETPADLRRADEAQAGPQFDPRAADDAVSRAFGETRPMW